MTLGDYFGALHLDSRQINFRYYRSRGCEVSVDTCHTSEELEVPYEGFAIGILILDAIKPEVCLGEIFDPS